MARSRSWSNLAGNAASWCWPAAAAAAAGVGVGVGGMDMSC
jgi:hypothetical protein